MKFLLSVLAIVVAAFCVSVEGAMSQAEAQAKAELDASRFTAYVDRFYPGGREGPHKDTIAMIAHGLRRQDISLASLVQVAESITAMTHAHAEAEAEVDMEAELDVELDNELEASTEAEVETEAELDFELDAEADTDADEEADVDAEAQAAADAEAYAAAEIFTAGAMEAEVDAEAEAEAETETETAAVTDANAETEQEQEYETGADADADADAEAEAEAEGEAEGDEMSFLEKPPSESTAPAASGPNGSTKSVETAGNPAAAAPAVDTAAPGADANMRGPNGCLVHNGLECNGQRAGKCVQSICHCIAGWTGIRCQVEWSLARLNPYTGLAEATPECGNTVSQYLSTCN